MKTQAHHKTVLCRLFHSNTLLSAGMIVVFCMLSTLSFSQAVNIVSPATNQTYKLPDPAIMQTPAEVQRAIADAETAGKALNADAIKERAITLNETNDFNKAKTMNSNYLAAFDNFAKNDVAKYKIDLDNYTASGTKYNEMLAAYNKAALANNALPAKKRKAATVAALNKQKAQIDASGAKLTKWKIRLDAAKAKLDVENAALPKQKLRADAALQTATEKLKASKKKIKSILDQSILCASYADKCHALLVSKFNNTAASDLGYFGTPGYKTSIADLNTDLEKLKNLPGMVWDGK